jgi:large subunit ribosomal protein L6
MSRVGKAPIPVPTGVTVTVSGATVSAKGPLGQLEFEVPAGIAVAVDGGQIRVRNEIGPRLGAALHGVTRAQVANLVTGVSKGYEKTLEIVGTGWKAAMAGRQVEVHVGFNHPVRVDLPEGISAEVADRPPKITIKGIRKDLVGQIAADIRKIRPPEPYLGKGIRYAGEQVRRKAGKSAG